MFMGRHLNNAGRLIYARTASEAVYTGGIFARGLYNVVYIGFWKQKHLAVLLYLIYAPHFVGWIAQRIHTRILERSPVLQRVLNELTAPLKPKQAMDGLIWRNSSWLNNMILSMWAPLTGAIEHLLTFGPVKVLLGDRPPLVAGIA